MCIRDSFYSGNKKINSVTGKEEVFNTPVRSVTGEDISVKKGINLVKATEGDFSQSIKIDGGDQGKAISEFKGPVVFSNKVTSSSTKGLEATSLFLQGESTVSRKYTVGIATPTDAGTPGDITFKENPEGGKYLGWVYTTDKAWKRFGSISSEANSDVHTFDKLFVYSGATDDAAWFESTDASINIIIKDSLQKSVIQQNGGDFTFSADDNNAYASSNLIVKVDSSEKLRISGFGSVGVGTGKPRAALDLWDAGAVTKRFAILPKLTTTQRGNLVGLHTGAIIYNTTTAKFQGYNGAWVDLH